MKELASQKMSFDRKDIPKKEAIAYFTDKGDEYKVELLEELEAVDCTSCLIARAYCYIKMGKNKLAIKDVNKINLLFKRFPEFDQHKSFWQLFKIYQALNKQKKAIIYLNKAHQSLLKKLSSIKDNKIKDVFLNTPDALFIKNAILDK